MDTAVLIADFAHSSMGFITMNHFQGDAEDKLDKYIEDSMKDSGMNEHVSEISPDFVSTIWVEDEV